MDMRTGKIREIPPGIAKEFEMLFVKGADPAKELKGCHRQQEKQL